MRISNQTYELAKAFGYEGAVRLNCEGGFEAIDFTMYKRSEPIFSPKREKTILEMKKIADSYGVVFNQAHAPFPHILKPDRHFTAEGNREAHECVKEAIRIAGELGCERIIVHPIHFPTLSRSENTEKNVELFSDLISLAGECHVQIAIENMWGRHRDLNTKIIPNVASTGEDFADFIDAFYRAFGKGSVSACLDVGHSGLVGDSADSAIICLGDRLSALHLHDNDFLRDMHTLPYFESINFDKILASLAAVGYSGDLTFEADGIFERLPKGLYPATLKYLAEIGKYMRGEFLKYKAENN